MTYLTKNLAFFSNLDGMQAICAEKMFAEKVVPKHPFSLTAFGRFPFLSLRDIFPRPGEVSPRGSAFTQLPQSFPPLLKPSPCGRWLRAK